jgi:hypothetical protein
MKDALIAAAAAMAVITALLAAFYKEDATKRYRKTLDKGASPDEASREGNGRGARYKFRLVVLPALAAVGLNIAAIIVPRYNGGMHAIVKEALIPPAAAMCAFAALLTVFYDDSPPNRPRKILNRGASPDEASRRGNGRGARYKFGLVVVAALAAVGLNVVAIIVPRL